MGTFLAVLLAAVGLILIMLSAERLVKGVVGTSIGFGISVFLISVVFIGFDPENLAVGAVGSYEEEAGIALGSIIGAAMVAIGLAFGVTAMLAPMRFRQVPRRVLAVPVLAVLVAWLLGLDGELSRLDGAILLSAFVLAVGYLAYLSRQGADIHAGGEVAETLEEVGERGPQRRWTAAALMLGFLIVLLVGSELLVEGSEEIIDVLDIDETFYGMTILALLVSIEELARELPAARAGMSEISFGNVVGSILGFFLMNAGIIALVRPVPVAEKVSQFYFPVCIATLLVISLLMLRHSIPRWAGGLLVALYGFFLVGGYLL